jgi:NAD(P)-dependent dehydrogenase (short-subunit alcohol dehydrogenase family)
MDRLKDKRALVTGGTSGIGLETARQFLKEGARIAITGSNPKTLEAARAELGDVRTIHADAGDVVGQRAVADAVRESFGGLDVVFVNAGIADFRPLDKWDEAGFDRSVAVNLKGPFFLIQALLPILANPASIVLNTSINAHIGMPNSSIYAATKAGLISLARTLSGELLSRGIRVNAISPGPIATPLHGKIGMDADPRPSPRRSKRDRPGGCLPRVRRSRVHRRQRANHRRRDEHTLNRSPQTVRS